MCRQRTLGLLLSFPVTQWRGSSRHSNLSVTSHILALTEFKTHPGVEAWLASVPVVYHSQVKQKKRQTNKKKTEVTHSTQPSMTARWGHCVPGPDAAASPTHVTVIPERHSPLSLCSEDTQPEKRVAGIWGSAGHSVGAVGLQI